MTLIEELYSIFDATNTWETDLVVKRYEYLKRAGEKETHIYYVVSGAVRVYYLDEETDHSIRFGYRNNFITLLDSLLTGQASNLSLQAIKKTTVKRVSKASIHQLILTQPRFKELWHSTLASLIHQQMEREIDLLTAAPLLRYQRVIERSPQLFQAIPHKLIASYLRMTPETLSRIKKLDLNQDL